MWNQNWKGVGKVKTESRKCPDWKVCKVDREYACLAIVLKQWLFCASSVVFDRCARRIVCACSIKCSLGKYILIERKKNFYCCHLYSLICINKVELSNSIKALQNLHIISFGHIMAKVTCKLSSGCPARCLVCLMFVFKSNYCSWIKKIAINCFNLLPLCVPSCNCAS